MKEILTTNFRIGGVTLQVRRINGAVNVEVETPEGHIYALEKPEITKLSNALLVRTDGQTKGQSAASIKGQQRAKTGRRYKDHEKSALLEGFAEAENKTKFCEENDVAMLTIHRWQRVLKAEKKAQEKKEKMTANG